MHSSIEEIENAIWNETARSGDHPAAQSEEGAGAQCLPAGNPQTRGIPVWFPVPSPFAEAIRQVLAYYFNSQHKPAAE